MPIIARIAIVYSDRELNEATVTITIESNTEPLDALTLASLWISAMSVITSAIVRRISITYTNKLNDGMPLGTEELCQERVLIFLANGSGAIHSIAVPCADPSIWIDAGPYAGNIIDESLPWFEDWKIAFNALIANFLHQDGVEWDYEYQIGVNIQ